MVPAIVSQQLQLQAVMAFCLILGAGLCCLVCVASIYTLYAKLTLHSFCGAFSTCFVAVLALPLLTGA